jgi:alkaline ceramidase
MPPILMYLFRDYGKKINPGIHLVWTLLICVGISSAYFHATLSLMGQLLDELSILWIYTLTMCIFCPRRKLPKMLKNRFIFSSMLLTLSIVATVASFWKPYINAFALMTLILPTVYLLWCELDRIKDEETEVFKLGVRSLVLMVIIKIIIKNNHLM